MRKGTMTMLAALALLLITAGSPAQAEEEVAIAVVSEPINVVDVCQRRSRQGRTRLSGACARRIQSETRLLHQGRRIHIRRPAGRGKRPGHEHHRHRNQRSLVHGRPSGGHVPGQGQPSPGEADQERDRETGRSQGGAFHLEEVTPPSLNGKSPGLPGLFFVPWAQRASPAGKTNLPTVHARKDGRRWRVQTPSQRLADERSWACAKGVRGRSLAAPR